MKDNSRVHPQESESARIRKGMPGKSRIANILDAPLSLGMKKIKFNLGRINLRPASPPPERLGVCGVVALARKVKFPSAHQLQKILSHKWL